MTANISDIVEVHEKASSTTLSLTAFLLLFVGWKGGRAYFIVPLCTFLQVCKDFSNGKFYIPWRKDQFILVPNTKKHIQEVSESNDMSQRAVYADIFKFRRVINDPVEHYGAQQQGRVRLNGRLLQTNGPRQLEKMYPYISEASEKLFDEKMGHVGNSSNGAAIAVPQIARTVAKRTMSLVFFGEELTAEPKFFDALVNYPEDVKKGMLVLEVIPQWCPEFIKTMVWNSVTGGGKYMHFIINRLKNAIDASLKDPNTRSEDRFQGLTILDNIIEMTKTNSRWWSENIAQTVLAFWLASSLQPWMVTHWILCELSLRSEYQDAIHKEIEDNWPLDYKSLESLPLLDSFIKESARLNPVDNVTLRRKALSDFHFSDGSQTIPKGASVCINSRELLRDEQFYRNANEFDGFRHVKREAAPGSLPQSEKVSNKHRFTEISDGYPLWGYGQFACKGRYQASLVVKLLVSQFIIRYEMRLEDPNAKRQWIWESFNLPYENTKIVFTERKTYGKARKARADSHVAL